METTAPPPHASGPEDPDYRTKALQDLKRAVEGNLRALQDAVSQTPLDTVAWRARNLLELSIWVAYCASSHERAKMFCEDAARDAIDMLNILPEDRRDPTYSYPATRAQLIAKAKQGGIEDIEDPFVRVHTAAEALGKKSQFSYWNKLFSKWAHPTALAVGNDWPLDLRQWLKDGFFTKGMEYGTDALAHIDQWLGAHPA